MSGANDPQSGLTRRSFFKASGLAAGALGIAGAAGMLGAGEWLSPVEAQAKPEEKVAYTFHNRHCQCLCSHKCTVRDGRLALIEPNELPNGESSMCAKGLSEVQHVYSAERVQTPMKRVGERGSGEFVSISWDEALQCIDEQLKKTQSEHGADSVLVIMAGEVRTTEYLFLQKILGARGVSDKAMNEGIDIGYANGFDQALGAMEYQTSTSPYEDWKRCKTIVNVGSNILETTLTYGSYFFDALESGTKIYTVDPHFSPTASKSSVWVPINPGTDPALYLGMISLVLDNSWYDEEYIKAYTSLPFLIDESSGKFLHAGDDASKADYLVWDARTDSAQPFASEDAEPLLEGVFEVGGAKARTAFELLKQHQKPYTLSWASSVTGIDEGVLFDMTQDYACNGPQILANGFGGGDKFWNSDVAGHASVILASLVGSIGADSGAGAGAPVTSWRRGKLNFGSWPLPAEFTAGKNTPGAYDIRDDERVRAVITGGNCLHDRMANMQKTIEWMNSLDFILAIDIYHTPTTGYADIVLPACSRYESDEEVGMLHSGHHCVMLKEKVLDPLFESKTDFWIEREIAKLFGAEQHLPASAEELVKYQLEKSTDERVAQVTIEDLVAHHGVYPIPWKEGELHYYTDKKFKTPSGRLELYYENLLDFDNALPTFDAPIEVALDKDARGAYPLQLGQQHTRFLTHCAFTDATWIRQFIEPLVELNPQEADKRGLMTGDVVKVFNNRGSFTCKLQVNECIRPGSARVYEGWWTSNMIEGNVQMVTNDKRNERGAKYQYGPVIPYNDTLVEIEKA